MRADRHRSWVICLAFLCAVFVTSSCDRSETGQAGGGSTGDCNPETGACARKITSEAGLIGGNLALGQVGDFVLENDQVRIIVQRPIHHIAVPSQYGGNIIDADMKRGAGDPGQDVFGEMGFLVNLAGTMATESVEVAQAGGADQNAVVVARGKYDWSGYFMIGQAAKALIGFDPFKLRGVDMDKPWPLRFEVRYILPPQGRALRVELTALNQGSEPVPFILAYFVQGGQVNLFLPGRRAFGSGDVGLADMIFFKPVASGIPVGYGVVPDGRMNRFLLAMLGAQVLLHKGEIAEIALFPDQAPDVIPPGESMTFGSYFVVGEDLDHSIETAQQVADQYVCTPFIGQVLEEGTNTPIEGVDVTALQVPGANLWPQAITNATTDSEGRFRLCLPAGRAALIAGQPGRPYAGGGSLPPPVKIDVPARKEAKEEPAMVLHLPATARLRVSVSDSIGEPISARLTVLGIDPSPPDKRLRGDAFDPYAPGVVLMKDSSTGVFDVLVEPGDMDVVVTRGVEYDLFRRQLVLAPGEVRELDVVLNHVVDTRGILSGDFHVHSNPGPDSTLTYRDRATNMLAEGVDVIVATDHSFISDYWPTIRELGAQGKIATIAGQEITTFATGHFGPFPLPRTDEPNGGAVNWVSKDPVQLAEEVLGRSPAAVFQIMHPRGMPAPGNISNYFTTIDLTFDPNGPKLGPDAVDPADVRLPAEARWLSPLFNAMEIMTFGNVQGLSDWFNLLNAGWRLTATGNSDTHTRWVEGSGYARNLVRVGEGYDDLEAFDAERFAQAVREGRSTAVLGPFIDMTVSKADGSNPARIGDVLHLSEKGEVRIDVRVQSPAWLVCDELAIYENGHPIYELSAGPSLVPAEGGGERNEFVATIFHEVSQDAHLVARVTGSQSLYPLLPYNWESRKNITLEQIRSGNLPGTILPFSVTNPVWVDADGDGSITASHLIVEQDCQNFRKDDRTNPYVEVPAKNCECVLGRKAPGC